MRKTASLLALAVSIGLSSAQAGPYSYGNLLQCTAQDGRPQACVPVVTAPASPSVDSTGGPAGGAVNPFDSCGDGTCSLNESNLSCPSDCVSVNGVCGTAQGTTVPSYPAGSAACNPGGQQAIDSTGAQGVYRWNCIGSTGGVTAVCSANRRANGVCGPQNGSALGVPPTSPNACNDGQLIVTDPDGADGQYNWVCAGFNGGSNANCAANRN